MAVNVFRAEVSSKQNLAGSFWYLNLSLAGGEKIDFRAGQFVMLTVDGKKNIRRAYSIASSPFLNNQIGLLINVSPGGPGSSWALSCRTGSEVCFSGPFGKFVLDDGGKGDLVFIATGAGIAPIRSMVDRLKEKKDQRPVELWWGVRSQADVFWQDYFESLEKKWKNWHFHLTLSQSESGWQGLTGRVTDHLKNLSGRRLMGKDFYICGSRAMVEDVKEILLEKGAPETSILHEKF